MKNTNTMKSRKVELVEALCMLRNALRQYDTEISHNILIGGGTDESLEQQEENICNYLDTLDELIEMNKFW